VKQYQTLKTFSADFLSSLCKFQDGTLTHIFEHALGVIEKKIKSIYSPSTMLLVVACLREHLKERRDLRSKIAQLFMLLFDVLPLPVVDEQHKKEEDIEYAYLLLTMSKLILSLKELYPQIVQICYKVGIAVLQSLTTSEVHHSFALDMFNEILRIDEGEKYVHDIVRVFNHLLLSNKEPSIHLLDSYFDLIKFNADVLKQDPSSLLEGLKIISLHIENEAKKNSPNQLLINKCWNIIREVG
jgi:hypothetical protein